MRNLFTAVMMVADVKKEKMEISRDMMPRKYCFLQRATHPSTTAGGMKSGARIKTLEAAQTMAAMPMIRLGATGADELARSRASAAPPPRLLRGT